MPHNPPSIEDRLEAIRQHCEQERESVSFHITTDGGITVFLEHNNTDDPDFEADSFADFGEVLDQVEMELGL